MTRYYDSIEKSELLEQLMREEEEEFLRRLREQRELEDEEFEERLFGQFNRMTGYNNY